MINRDDIPVEDLMETEYETLQLVDCLITKHPQIKTAKAIKNWLDINDNPDTFNDIRLKK